MSHPVSPDRRKSACQTGLNIPFLGPCTQHWRSSSAHIPRWENVTKVQTYFPSGSPWIDPFQRPEANTAPDCSEYNRSGCPDNPCYDCGNGINGNPYCGPGDPSQIQPCASESYSGNLFNCYDQTTGSVDLSSCEKLGFKNVIANHKWRGRKSFTSREWDIADDFVSCCGGCGYHGYDSTPDTTKYLSVSASATVTVVTNNFHCDGTTYVADPVTTETQWAN